MSGERFAPDERQLQAGPPLGGGSGGRVVEASDPALRRVVALKVMRPRRPDEDDASLHARETAFRREAVLTASLEHPGIVPVHDLGSVGGDPAFAMKPLAGTPLSDLIAGGGIGPARAADILLRAAEAVGYAHARGVVHRDLKPEHVWIGGHGEVTVIDWGLAARVGEDARRTGTVGWRSPEQEAAGAADPSMDVWALGGLLAAMLGGSGPRGLVAIATRCRAPLPTQRYADAAALAADLRRWLAEGVSLAERPGPIARAAAALRRSPVLAALAALCLAAAVAAVWLPLHAAADRRAAALAALAEIDQEPLADARQVVALRRRLQQVVAGVPGLPEARLAEARLDGAARQFEDAGRRRLLADTLDALERSWRVRGPWADERGQLGAALAAAGMLAEPVRGCPADGHAEWERLHRGALQLLRADRDAMAPPDPRVVSVLAACRGTAMDAAARVIAAGDAAKAAPADVEAALADPAAVDMVLASCLPDGRMLATARRRLDEDPGAFWPRVCLAQDAARRAAWPEARAHALVALGRESTSVWPRLVLAYASLADAAWGAVLVDATHAAAASPGHPEACLLQAVALARLGRPGDAAGRLAEAGPRLARLLVQPAPPIDALVAAARAAGLDLPAAAPQP